MIFRRFTETIHWFDQKEPDWGFTSMFPLDRLNAKKSGFLMNGEVKIVAEVKVLEVIGKIDVPEESKEAATQPLQNPKMNDDAAASSDDLVKETPADWVDISGFQILSSQVMNTLFF